MDALTSGHSKANSFPDSLLDVSFRGKNCLRNIFAPELNPTNLVAGKTVCNGGVSCTKNHCEGRIRHIS